MWVEMLWIPAFAGMTEETDGLDKSSPYLDRRDACPTVLYKPLGAYSNTPLLLFIKLVTCNSKLITCHTLLSTYYCIYYTLNYLILASDF